MNITIYLPKSETWKVQLAITIKFIFSKDVNEEQVLHSKNDNIKFMTYDNVIYDVDELLCRYEIDLESSMRRANFIFDTVHVLYYKCHKRCHIDFQYWIKK